MKKLLFLLLLFPLYCSSQSLILRDTTYNIKLPLPQYEGAFISDYNKNIVFENYTNSINNITLDTLNNTLSVRRESKKSYTVLNWDLTLTYINTHKGVGTTYNFQDDTTGGYGFLYVQDNGIIIFVSKSPMESDTYLGFLGFLDQK
tara:strand:+ start:17423 stop:17860 length:438 start_codon:yes stop_codon:yes gene_type:complete